MTPRPASTVVVVREGREDIEVLLLLRNTALVFNGGYWVFPGGKIDPADYPGPGGSEYEAAQRAVVRETREEAGIDIPQDGLIHIAHWTTPPGLPRRYSTWFFVCPLRSSAPIVVDDSEILDYRWLSPRQALAEKTAGALMLTRPTAATLELIEPHRSLGEVDRACRRMDIHVFPRDSRYYVPPPPELQIR